MQVQLYTVPMISGAEIQTSYRKNGEQYGVQIDTDNLRRLKEDLRTVTERYDSMRDTEDREALAAIGHEEGALREKIVELEDTIIRKKLRMLGLRMCSGDHSAAVEQAHADRLSGADMLSAAGILPPDAVNLFRCSDHCVGLDDQPGEVPHSTYYAYFCGDHTPDTTPHSIGSVHRLWEQLSVDDDGIFTTPSGEKIPAGDIENAEESIGRIRAYTYDVLGVPFNDMYIAMKTESAEDDDTSETPEKNGEDDDILGTLEDNT